MIFWSKLLFEKTILNYIDTPNTLPMLLLFPLQIYCLNLCLNFYFYFFEFQQYVEKL